MIFSPVNIEKALIKERNKNNTSADKLMEEVSELLNQSAERDNDIFSRLNNCETSKKTKLTLVDSTNIFSLNEIKTVCENYRLRFLDSGHFKGEIPYEAIIAIKNFENKYQVKIESFKIIAPAGMFKLEDIHQDPLLFASIGNDKYYLIHKWGNDLAWYRKLISYPLRNIYSFFYSLFIMSAILSFLVPESWLNMPMGSLTLRLWLTVHLFIGFSGFLIFIGSTMQKNFSSNVWDSKFFN
jgi:hypothetical protein